MSNLAQYRFSIVMFSLGLLFVVSEVVGDGEKPGALDVATTSVVHRLKSGGADAADQEEASYELAVTDRVGDASGDTAAPHLAVTNALPAPPESEADGTEESSSGPDPSMVHK
jgi:hypothetical protein